MRQGMAMRARTIGAFLLAAACAGAQAQQGPRDKPGGHPLARRQVNLADLLEQPDWGAPTPARPPAGQGDDRPEPAVAPQPAPDRPQPRPQAEQMPRPQAEQMPPRPPAAPDVMRDLQAAIDERNRIVNQSNLFDTIATILKEEQELARRGAVLDAALERQKAAAEQAELLNHPGANQVSPADKANAMQAWRNAQAASQAALGAWQQQLNTLQPLYARVRPAIGPWMDCYWRMRRAIRFDRRDPDRQSTLGALENAIRQRDDFHEARVLAAILQVYEGNAGVAEDHMKQACAGMAKFGLFGTPFANDGCYAYLLLGRPDMVADFIAALRKLDAGRQTAVRRWLVGLSGMLECKDIEAATYLRRALAKVDFFKGKDMPFEATPLLGDAALFCLTANNDTKRNVDLARKILAKTKPEWDTWQLLRARAALAAEDGDWLEALKQLDLCAEACPPAIAAEIEEQRAAYADEEPWIRPRPAVKAAANR